MYNKILVFAGLALVTISPVGASDHANAVSKTMVLDAVPSDTWRAIQAERKSDPEHKHVISHKGSDYVIEERFDKIPIIGTAVCVYKEHEIVDQELDYKLVRSDKFTSFEGSWHLSPCADGKKTQVTLTSFTETNVHVPFSGKLTHERTEKAVQQRLAALKARVRNDEIIVAEAQ